MKEKVLAFVAGAALVTAGAVLIPSANSGVDLEKKIVRVIIDMSTGETRPMLDAVLVGEVDGKTVENPIGLTEAPASPEQIQALEAMVKDWAGDAQVESEVVKERKAVEKDLNDK